jgi:hypothetical protein
MTYYSLPIPGWCIIKKQYSGYLGQHNKPDFPAKSYVLQSMAGIIHFHFCLN